MLKQIVYAGLLHISFHIEIKKKGLLLRLTDQNWCKVEKTKIKNNLFKINAIVSTCGIHVGNH